MEKLKNHPRECWSLKCVKFDRGCYADDEMQQALLG